MAKEEKSMPAETLASQVRKDLAKEIEAIRDPGIRAQAEKRLAEALEGLQEAAPKAHVTQKGLIDFISDWTASRRSASRERAGQRAHEGIHVDAFGFDRAYWRRVEPLFAYLYENYWRVETSGIEHVPTEGRTLLVANHSGILPWDALMLREAVEKEHPAQRHVRPLIEDYTATMPFLGPFLRRVGITRADQQNAERLLNDEKLVAIFPEGIQGIVKPYRERYRLRRFGRGGLVKLAIRTRSPVVPVAIVGGDEIYPVIGQSPWLGKVLGLPTLPLTPLFPWLGAAGLVPLPSKWFIRFGPPVDLAKLGKKALDDEILVNRLNEEVRSKVQELVYEVIRERRSAWLG